MVGPWVAHWIHGSHLATRRPYFSSTAPGSLTLFSTGAEKTGLNSTDSRTGWKWGAIPRSLPIVFQVEEVTEIVIRNFGLLHKFELPTVIADSVPRATRIFSLASVGRSRDRSHGESYGPDRPMPATILENFHCEQPCYGFLGLLKFLCSQTLPNLVHCFLIIFSLVWHPKDFAQMKITHGKNASNPSNRSAIVKKFSLCLTSHH